MQIAMIIGVMGKDPLYSNNGSCATFSVAVNDGKDKDGKPLTTWYSVKAWDKMLNVVNRLNLQKGNRVFVCGELSVTMYNGSPVKTITANTIELIYSNKGQSGNQNYQQQNNNQYQQRQNQDYVQQQVMTNVQNQQIYDNLADDDDLPF